MAIAESDIRINAAAHRSDAGERKTPEFRNAYGEDGNGAQSVLAPPQLGDKPSLFRSDTALPPAFVAQVLSQASAVPRATALEAAQTYACAPHEAPRKYVFV